MLRKILDGVFETRSECSSCAPSCSRARVRDARATIVPALAAPMTTPDGASTLVLDMTRQNSVVLAPKRRSVPKRTRIAYHEAGHAVLGHALNGAPSHVSIRPENGSLGRTRQQPIDRPEVAGQIHLAGFAAEQILKDRRPRQLDHGVADAVTSLLHPEIASLAANVAGGDQAQFVEEVVAMGCDPTREAILAEVERYYAAALASLKALWPAVEATAKALLTHETLEGHAVVAALGGHDIYTPVFAVQDAHDLSFKAVLARQTAPVTAAPRVRTRKPR